MRRGWSREGGLGGPNRQSFYARGIRVLRRGRWWGWLEASGRPRGRGGRRIRGDQLEDCGYLVFRGWAGRPCPVSLVWPRGGVPLRPRGASRNIPRMDLGKFRFFLPPLLLLAGGEGVLNRGEIGMPHFFPFERDGPCEVIFLEKIENLVGGHFAGSG